MSLVGERHVTIEDEVIVDVAESRPTSTADVTIDARGHFVLPGFIDAHVHHVFPTMDFPRLFAMRPVELAIAMARHAEAFVRRGFTTVRDTGGDTAGLVDAIAAGRCGGPRIVRAGRPLSQTGGHADFSRPAGIGDGLCSCQVHSSAFSHVADGPDAVRTAARSELRDGADFIKIMASGGVASPDDPFDAMQYTAEEIGAITVETDHRHTYTTAHAYQPDAMRLAVENGVRCIEHGNLLDAGTATLLVEHGVTLVPTLVTYAAMKAIGAEVGLPARNLEKNDGVLEHGLRSIEVARAAGVRLGLGTDLLGEASGWQRRELEIRADLEPASDVLRSMYVVNAELLGLSGTVGVLAPGAAADVVVTAVDPLEDLAGLAADDAVVGVVARGRVVVDVT